MNRLLEIYSWCVIHSRTNLYNSASNVVTYTDENSSNYTNTLDPMGRKMA